MRLIIAGGRDLRPDYGFILSAIKMLSIANITEIVSGGATGVDSEGEHFAGHMRLPVKSFDADWASFGYAAGPIRNRQMAEYADELLIIWNGKSKGSANMKEEMLRRGKIVHEILLQGGLQRDIKDIV